MYVVMIKNINSPEQSIIKTYLFFNKMYKYYDKYSWQHTFLIYVCHRINELSYLLINIYHHVSVHFVKQKLRCHYWLFRWINIFYHDNVHLCIRNVCCHELSHLIINIYHHVSVHFVKQNVRCHYWLLRFNLLLLSRQHTFVYTKCMLSWNVLFDYL